MAPDEVAPILGSRRPLLAGAVIAAAAALLSPSGAKAIDPGVIYDPGSPAGKQYAIPLEQARRDTGSPGHATGIPAYAAFGVGVKPPGAGGGGGASRPGGQGSSGGLGGNSGGGVGRARGGARHGGASGGQSGADLRRRLADAEPQPGSTSWTLWIVLAVLVPGAALGLALNRLQRRTT